MKTLIKKLIKFTPISCRKLSIKIYENYFTKICRKKDFVKFDPKISNFPVKNILIYHRTALSHGGTEKNLQYIANDLSIDYNVFILQSGNKTFNPRYKFINEKVKIIEFDYTKMQSSFPFCLEKMSPQINDVIKDNNIDLIITANSGYADYPINTVKNIPIILINIFGSPTTKENVMKDIYISNEVKQKAEFYTGNKNGEVLYIPTNGPLKDYSKEVEILRERFNIKENEFVFGRIGRDSDSIFDPIGINAFKKISKEFNNVHYLIMSSPPILKKIVLDEKIKNVHFIDSSSNEDDVWTFHFAIDCLAHFRNDGESCGLNIAESMFVGNPIISHKSHIWNAHTEYLDNSFSRVAKKDDSKKYYEYMKEFVLLKQNNESNFNKMREEAKKAANKYFNIENYNQKIKEIIQEIK